MIDLIIEKINENVWMSVIITKDYKTNAHFIQKNSKCRL